MPRPKPKKYGIDTGLFDPEEWAAFKKRVDGIIERIIDACKFTLSQKSTDELFSSIRRYLLFLAKGIPGGRPTGGQILVALKNLESKAEVLADAITNLDDVTRDVMLSEFEFLDRSENSARATAAFAKNAAREIKIDPGKTGFEQNLPLLIFIKSLLDIYERDSQNKARAYYSKDPYVCTRNRGPTERFVALVLEATDPKIYESGLENLRGLIQKAQRIKSENYPS